MLVSTSAIVLKSIKYSESSIIAKLYTRSHGVLSFIVNGVRSSKKNHKAVLFQPLTFLNIEMYYKEPHGLLRLKEFNHDLIFTSIPFDIVKISIVQFLLEVLGQCLNEEEENEVLFEFLHHFFKTLDKEAQIHPNAHLIFLVKFMDHIGISPDNNFSTINNSFSTMEGSYVLESSDLSLPVDLGTSELLSKLLNDPYAITLDKSTRKELTQLLLNYYRTHVAGFKPIQSLKILELIYA